MSYETTEEILRSITIPQVNLLPSTTSFVKIYQASDQFELLDSEAHVSRDKIIESFHRTIEAFRQLKQEFEEALADSHLSNLEYNFNLSQEKIRSLYKDYKRVTSERNTLSETLKGWKQKLIEKDDQLIKTFKREEIMNHKLRGRLNNFKEVAKRKNKAIKLLITASEENGLTLSEFNHLYKQLVRAYDTDSSIDIKVVEDGIIQFIDTTKEELDDDIVSFSSLKDSYAIRTLSSMILEDRRFILNCIQSSDYDYNRILKSVDEYYQRNAVPDDEYDTGLNSLDVPEIDDDTELDEMLKEESMPSKIHFFRVKQAISACIEKVLNSQNSDLTSFELDADDAYQDALSKIHIVYNMVKPIMVQHNPKVAEARQKVKFNVTRLRESLDDMKRELRSMNASFKKFITSSKKKASSLKTSSSRSRSNSRVSLKRSRSKVTSSASLLKSEAHSDLHSDGISSSIGYNQGHDDPFSDSSSSFAQQSLHDIADSDASELLQKVHQPSVVVSSNPKQSKKIKHRHTSHGYRRSLDQSNLLKTPLHRPCHTHRAGPYFPKLSKSDTISQKPPNVSEVDVSYWFKESKRSSGTRRFNRILHPYLNK